MKSKKNVSEAAWAQRGNFETDSFHDHRVIRTDKTVIVMAPFSWFSQRFAKPKSTPKRNYVFSVSKEDIVVFPKPVHMPHFVTASKGTRMFGPSQHYSAAIGTVQVRLYLAKSKQRLRLSFAQAHFKTRDPAEPNKHALPRSIATYYGGWRKRALTEAVKLAVHVDLPLEIHWSKLYPKKRAYPGVSPLHRELLEVASSLGVRAREVRSDKGRFLVINPAKR